ncbi:MAG: RCC1 repeat- and reductase domain-containing protein [Flavobacteriales bacterium]|nr:RCC1 repeat- and reductase domain-containing protein [Flavobacteriales bacterium]
MRLKIPLLSVGLAMACLGPPTDLAAQIISGGGKHCLSVCSDSTVQAWGYNLYGQLGNDDNDDSNVPVSVGSLTGVIAVEGGGIGHSLALKSDSTVWAWGLNLFGQLGDGSTTSRDVPVLVDQLNGIVSITGGGGAHHSLALRADGTVWSWGYNEFGQLGNGTNVDSHIPVPVGSLSDVKAVSAGAFHSLALKDDGTVWAWGYNAQGQLGNGLEGFENNSILPVPVSILTDVIAIEGGQLQSIALTNDGFVWAWGNNFYGQLGNGTNTNSNVPVLIGSIENITAIAAGRSCFFALKSDGTVWAWGNNIYGTLGDGTTVDRNVPVQVAGFLTSSLSPVAGPTHLPLTIMGRSGPGARTNMVVLGTERTMTAAFPCRWSERAHHC